jgi:hypothetical protein
VSLNLRADHRTRAVRPAGPAGGRSRAGAFARGINMSRLPIAAPGAG